MLEQKPVYDQLTKLAMPKVPGSEGNDDEDDVAEKVLKAALTPTIYKEDVRIIISEASKATPSKAAGPPGASAGAGFKKPTPQKRPLGGGQFSRGPKMGGGFGGPRKPIGGGVKPNDIPVGKAADRASGHGLRRDMDGGGNASRGAGHPPVGDQCNRMSLVLEVGQHRC